MSYRASSILRRVFVDWQANAGNPKGRAVLVAFRLASEVRHWPIPLRYMGLLYVALYRVVIEWFLGVELPWKLSAGPGLRIYHGQALVVSDRAVIGCGCTLRNSTTIGVAKTSLGYAGKAPRIGNYVDVGANVVIIGDVSVGDHVVVGAGSVIVKDVPPGATVVGNPARVISISNDHRCGS